MGLFGGTGSGCGKAQILALACPVGRQVKPTDKPVGRQIPRLTSEDNCFDDIEGQISETQYAGEIGGIHAINCGEIGTDKLTFRLVLFSVYT